MRRDIVFVHIPKTAGTSLRELIEGCTGKTHTLLRDYWNAPETTPALFKLVHEEKRIRDFRKTFDSRDKGILLSGHFPAQRYWPYFNAESFVTFLRHPVDRLISEYVHLVTLNGWTEPLETFAARPKQCRAFAIWLQNVNLDAFGFIGFMEDFDATLPALSEWLGVELPPRRTNAGNYAAMGVDPRNDENVRALIAGLAADDIALYERLRRERIGNPRARGDGPDIEGQYVGRVRAAAADAVGWIVNKGREFIAEVELSSGGETLAVVAADRYRADLIGKGSRSGVCGFRVALSEIVPGGRTARPVPIHFRVKGTGYELLGSPVEFSVPTK